MVRPRKEKTLPRNQPEKRKTDPDLHPLQENQDPGPPRKESVPGVFSHSPGGHFFLTKRVFPGTIRPMPLQEFYSKRALSIKSREKHRCVLGLKRKMRDVSFDKTCRIIDEILEQLVQDRLGKLVYTRTGFLLGHQSILPHADHKYIWDKVPTILINKNNQQLWDPLESKLVLQTIGAMVMWRIALRPENWLVSFLESGKFDVVTGNEIKIAQYWVH